MAARYNKTARQSKLQLSPERNRVWTEPNKGKFGKIVPVIYYLSRNGHLDHPHFIEVSLPSDLGLHLKDVIKRLDALRGKGMATSYSWSSKRSYKNGFVWQDLSGEDYIHPAQGNEYILKGSEILNLSSPSYSTTSSSEPDFDINNNKNDDGSDLNEYRVCKSSVIINASTQTEDIIKTSERRDEIEISPPESTSTVGSDDQERTAEIGSSGRFKASAVLMQLVSCVHVAGKEDIGFSALGDEKATGGSFRIKSSNVVLEDKEYFSGSVIEVKKKDGVPVMKRSNSYNADKDRNWKQEMNSVKQMDDARALAKCIPRKNKSSGKGGNQDQRKLDDY